MFDKSFGQRMRQQTVVRLTPIHKVLQSILSNLKFSSMDNNVSDSILSNKSILPFLEFRKARMVSMTTTQVNILDLPDHLK
jgi:hypothetical protein